MPRRSVYHITQRSDGDWQAKLRGSKRASVVADNKQDVVDAARKLAKAAPLGQIVLHYRRGVGGVQTEHTYREDPRRYPG